MKSPWRLRGREAECARRNYLWYRRELPALAVAVGVGVSSRCLLNNQAGRRMTVHPLTGWSVLLQQASKNPTDMSVMAQFVLCWPPFHSLSRAQSHCQNTVKIASHTLGWLLSQLIVKRAQMMVGAVQERAVDVRDIGFVRQSKISLEIVNINLFNRYADPQRFH